MTDSLDIQRANQRFMRGAMSIPLLSAARETALAQAWAEQGDEDALHELVASHFRLVIRLAAQYARRYGLSFADLMQEGHLGLMQAAGRFDAERGVRFSTYAVWWVRAAIQDFVLRNASVVRMGTTTADKRLFFNLRRLRARMASLNGAVGAPEREAIAAGLGVAPGAVDDMEARLSGPDRSIDAPIDDEGETEWGDMLIDERPSPEAEVAERMERQTHHRWISDALEQLPAREALIVRRRHLRERAQTLEELGAELGVSKERVRQLEKRALDRLRKLIAPWKMATAPAE